MCEVFTLLLMSLHKEYSVLRRRHHDIAYHQIELQIFHQFQCLDTVTRLHHLEFVRQGFRNEHSQIRVVLYNQDFRALGGTVSDSGSFVSS